MDDVLFISNSNDDAEIEKIKWKLKEKGSNYSVLIYNEIKRDRFSLEKLIKEKRLKVMVLFIGYGALNQESSGLLRNFFQAIPSLVVILKTAAEPLKIPIFLQALQYVDFRRESEFEALEHLDKAISERIGWDWS